MPSPSRPPPPRGLPAWFASWLAILAATGLAVLVLQRLAVADARDALEGALRDHLVAQAGSADGALHELPVELLAAMHGEKSEIELRSVVRDLESHSRLRGLALLGPAGEVEGHAGEWLPLAAERDLVEAARGGSPAVGPLYHDEAGELYQTAYVPLSSHPGWVVAVEGDAATLGAVDELAQAQLWAGGFVGLGAIGVAAILAAWLARPLRRLGAELGAVRPGAEPAAVGDYGYREVRGVAGAARELLAAIRTRDVELLAAHRREVDQLTRMAAEIAHEVGNPLNAVALSTERLATLEDPAAKARVLERVRGQLAELEQIVSRLRDLTRPLQPVPVSVALPEALASLAAEVPALAVELHVPAGATVNTDRVMFAEIVRNLLKNAGEAGATRVVVTASVSADRLEVEIVDDGPGVPDAAIDLVFAWFHTTRATGSGLGLPLSRRIAEALGGSLELVAARPATFRLRLPGAP